MVRGRPHPAYCARAVSSAQTLPAASTELQPQTQPHLRQTQLKPRKHPAPCTRTARAPAVSNEGSLPWLFALVAFVAWRIWLRPLTVKLSGRTMALDQRRGRTMSSSARGAQPLTPHGPLQRLLEAMARARPTASHGRKRTTPNHSGAHLRRRQRETMSGVRNGSTGSWVQSACNVQNAIPRDFSQATDLPSRKGGGPCGINSRGGPSCFVRAARGLSISVPGAGKGGTKTQTNPTARTRAPTTTAARNVMASNGEVERPHDAAR